MSKKTIADAPASADLAQAVAQVDVARLLIDLLENQPSRAGDALRVGQANALLARAGPVLRAAAQESSAQEDALKELNRQSARLGREMDRRR